ncbi:hypothetical protein FGRA07_04844 [Fusarium graminearum]|nr:hypothetical protein FGRA07_04844 [Fusarium graminearum]
MVVENHLISDHIVFAPEPNNDEEHVENRIIRLGDAKLDRDDVFQPELRGPRAEAPTYSIPRMSVHGDSHFRCLDIKYQGWVIVDEAASCLQVSDQPGTVISNMPAHTDEIFVHNLTSL